MSNHRSLAWLSTGEGKKPFTLELLFSHGQNKQDPQSVYSGESSQPDTLLRCHWSQRGGGRSNSLWIFPVCTVPARQHLPPLSFMGQAWGTGDTLRFELQEVSRFPQCGKAQFPFPGERNLITLLSRASPSNSACPACLWRAAWCPGLWGFLSQWPVFTQTHP